MSCSPVTFSHFLISSSIVKFIFKSIYVVLILMFMLRQIVTQHSFCLNVIARII
jgi:hypothetical protein